MIFYCSDCGEKHEYAQKKPNFCQACGTPFSLAAAKQKLKQPHTPVATNSYEQEEVTEVPKIDKLNVKVEKSTFNRQKLGSLFGTRDPNIPIESREPNKRVSKKAFMEQLSREAGNRKRESSQIG